MSGTRRELVRLPAGGRRLSRVQAVRRSVRDGVLTPAYWLLAHGVGTPGLDIHRRCAALGARLLLRGRRHLSPAAAFHCVVAPLDSVRYFEFDFAWRALSAAAPRAYLDVSSPRLLPALLLAERSGLVADLLNPDVKDLDQTRRLMAAAGLADRCRFHSALIDQAGFAPESFDVITSISVLEHIPDDGAAVRAIWRTLRPGGRLVLSVPCAREPFEEYFDYNEYGLLEPDERGFVFAQRFYSAEQLEQRVFSVTGQPVRQAVYGEKRPGLLSENRRQKVGDPRYPWYREAYMMGRDFTLFPRIDAMPASGVIAMEFVKG